MTRIFTILAGLDALGLIASYATGVSSKLTGGFSDPQGSIYLIHFTLGLSTAILTLLVHCLIFTYFLGTGRWVKEVALAYQLPDAPLPRLTRELKRQTFPWALTAMLLTIATAAAGAGAQMQDWHWMVHATLATVTLLVNLAVFVIEYRNVYTNAEVLERVMDEVERIRADRGLAPNAEALQQDEV
jgi:hypothetical protein